MNLVSQTAAEMLDQSRKFTLFYLSQLDAERIYERHTFDGAPINSAHFIMGHLAWAEWLFMTENLNQSDFEAPLAQRFHIKAKEEDVEAKLSFQEMQEEMARIHSATLESIRKLDSEALEEEVFVTPANWRTTRKKAIFHIIRHESFHTGQLALIAKVQGGKIP